MTILGSSVAMLDPIGDAVETGAILLAGTVPSLATGEPQGPAQDLGDADLQTWDRLGVPRQQLARTIVPTRPCGLAGAERDWALRDDDHR